MFTSIQHRSIATITAIVLFGLPPLDAQADGRSHDGHTHNGGAHEGHNHGGEVIAFRRVDWQEMHFDDPQRAELHFQAIERLGCEVRTDAHDGHFDVVYRCPEWRSIDVQTHELAQQWEDWLVGAGFDTSHGHVDEAFLSGAELVELRLTEWRTFHGDASRTAAIEQVAETLENIGCEVVRDNHGNHVDVRYRCPMWTEISFANHRTAEQWIAWLAANGFETQHEH